MPKPDRADACGFPGADQRVPKRLAMPGPDRDFVAQFTRERNSGYPCLEPGHPAELCQMGQDQAIFDERTRLPLTELGARSLIDLEEQQFGDGSVCLTPLLTDLGLRARAFIVNLMSAQLRTATVQ